MGIKDNFSQAVKELWKKDGQDGEAPQLGATEPSELDRYLREQNAAESMTAAQPTEQGTERIQTSVPLETPYYPNAAADSANLQNIQSSTVQNNAQQSAVLGESAVQNNAYGRNPNPAGGMGVQNTQSVDNGFNSNARVVNPSMGQSVRNDGFAQGYSASGYSNTGFGNQGNGGFNNQGGQGGGRFVPPSGNASSAPMGGESEETTIISKNTSIEGNVRSLANMTVDGNIKGNVETTRNVDMTGKIVGDIIANNAAMNSAAMQGNISLKGRMKMDRDTILIGDLSSQYADINGRIRGKLDIVGKAELKRDAIVFGDINASTIAVTDGAIIQGYVNTTFLSKDDSRNVFPDAISIEEQRQTQSSGMGGVNSVPNPADNPVG